MKNKRIWILAKISFVLAGVLIIIAGFTQDKPLSLVALGFMILGLSGTIYHLVSPKEKNQPSKENNSGEY